MVHYTLADKTGEWSDVAIVHTWDKRNKIRFVWKGTKKEEMYGEV